MRRSGLRDGSFSRVIALRRGTMQSDMTATDKDGLLVVRVPVEERPTSRSAIPIERGGFPNG